jgi:hypothetical protein
MFGISEFWILCTVSDSERTQFQKLDIVPSSGERMGPLERAGLK